MANKDYCIEILDSFSHGCYGKDFYASWCLNSNSKKNAVEFAYDILRCKTWREFAEELEGKARRAFNCNFYGHADGSDGIGWAYRHEVNDNDVIGDNAYKFFSIRADVLKW